MEKLLNNLKAQRKRILNKTYSTRYEFEKANQKLNEIELQIKLIENQL